MSMTGKPSVGAADSRDAVDAVIIGAGIAGLAAARRLIDAGLTVRVYDKGRGPGGRLSSRRGEGYSIDHGAQYFTASEPVFSRAVREWQAAGAVAAWPARVVSLTGAGAKPEAPALLRYVGVPTMSALPKHLAAGVPLTLNTVVTEIARYGDGWLLRAGGAALTRCRRLLVTVPAPQAVPLLAAAPPLAERAAAARMQPVWALLLAFDAALDVGYDAAHIGDDAALAWAARNASKPGRGEAETWLLHATPAWSRRELERSPDEAAGELLTAFARLLGRRLTPRFVRAHRWRYALPTAAAEEASFWLATECLGVAGDWCAGGQVELAYLSGLRLAEQVLASSGG